MSKYLLLECNRIRATNNQLKNDIDDKYKNTWTNQISSSGIVINRGDVISVEETIINSRGASDDVMEFRGTKNEVGFIDNKVRLSYSFYINYSAINTAKLPLFNHRTYRGNPRDALNISTLTPNKEDNPLDTDENNGSINTFSNDAYLEHYSKRSIGETFFYPEAANDTTNTNYTTDRYSGMTDSSIVSGGFLFRLDEFIKGGSSPPTAGHPANVNDGYKENSIYNTSISDIAAGQPTPGGTGLQIKVISVTSIGEIYGIIDKFEVFKIGSGYSVADLNTAQAKIQLENPTTGAAFVGTKQKFKLIAYPSASYKQSNIEGFDGSRYYFTNIDFSGFCNSREFLNSREVSPAFDLDKYTPDFTKRLRHIDLEVPEGFSTPDNVADILTDQLHNPNKISNENNNAPYLNYKNFDSAHLNREGAFNTDFSPVVIDTPTYTPTICNGSLSGNKGGDLNTFSQIRKRFYSTVAWKEPERIEGLNFFNTGYFKSSGFNNDTAIMTGRTTTDNYQGGGGNEVLGDFGNATCGEFGNHVVLLNTIKNTDFQDGNNKGTSNNAKLLKHTLIITNLKYTKENIEKIAVGFKKAEKYIGNLNNVADSTTQDYKNKLGVFLDIGMYDDELSSQGKRVKDSNGNFAINTKIKFNTYLEAQQYTALERPTDYNPVNNQQVELNAYQPDFNNVKNNGQELGGIWIKSRFQEGFKFNSTDADGKMNINNYTGEYVDYRNTFNQETGFTPNSSFFDMELSSGVPGFEDITFSSFFNSTYNTTETNFTGLKEYNDYIQLSIDNDIGAIPFFPRHQGNNTFVIGTLENNTPFISFVSSFEINDHNPDLFDPIGGTDNTTNKWRLDTNNCVFGTKIGLDKSFTRNDAVQIYNPQFNLDNEALFGGYTDGANYINYMYLGAVNPSINFNPSFSRFEVQGLNTPIMAGNGLLTDLPNDFQANESPESLNIQINRKGGIITAQQKNIGTVTSGTFSPLQITNFELLQKQGSILDSQSGISIESISLFDETGNITELNNTDYTKFSYSMFDKMGFKLNQLLPLLGNSNAFFTNPFIYQSQTETYLQTNGNIIKPVTTGAYISSSEVQTLSLNENNAPTFDLGGDSLRQTSTDITQGAITAFKLPSKLDIPYLVIYSSILSGGVDTQYIGGSDGFSKIPAISYLTRENNQSDYFYSPSGQFNFTATKDFTITDIETSIRLPDGGRPKLEAHSAVIYKITKPILSLPSQISQSPQSEAVKKDKKYRRRD